MEYKYDDGVKPCACCGRMPVILTCDYCGAIGRIIDCGNLAQPRPIASTEDGQHVICQDCVDEHGVNGPTEE